MDDKENIRFAFFGTGNFAKGILTEIKSRGLIPSLVVTSPDAPAGRKHELTASPVKLWAMENKIPLIQPETLKNFSIDGSFELFLVADYGKIIPRSVIDIPRLGTLCTHQSLLPKYRGTSPIQYAIRNGDTETGVSIMMIDEKVDHGKILAQEKEAIHNNDTSSTLAERLSKVGGRMIAEIFEHLDESIKNAKVQNEDEVTFTKLINSKDAFIEKEIVLGNTTKENAVSAERLVRAMNPEPIAWTELNVNGKELRIKILSAKIVDEKFVPEIIQPAGKKEMKWQDFLRGNRIG
jgi:methionyl-tRNA formyltransferase